MKVYAEAHNIMTQPRRSLIGSMKGDKILLARMTITCRYDETSK